MIAFLKSLATPDGSGLEHPALGSMALDVVAGISYLSIALVVMVFASKPKPMLFRWMYWWFAACMLTCGAEHLIGAGLAGSPLSTLVLYTKAVTALVALVMAAALWPLLPRALNLPTYSQIQSAYHDLAERVAERDQALRNFENAIAQRDSAEEMLRQSQKVEALGQVAGGLAHDFNNLLGVIVGNLDRASRLIDVGTKPYRAVIDAMSATERAVALVVRLMAFARREAPTLVDVPVDSLIAGLRPLIVGLAPGCDVRFELSCDGAIAVDVSQLENAIINLVVNARDAMPNGGLLFVRTRAMPADDASRGVSIEIEDTGTGMPADVKARIFEPFFTTKAAGFGTGLGLSQVAAFVRQIGGEVRLDSEAGRGTRIALHIPRADGAAAVATQRASAVAMPSNLVALASPALAAGELSRHLDGDGVRAATMTPPSSAMRG